MSEPTHPELASQAAWETEELFVQHSASLMRFLQGSIRNSNDLEDLTQEAFVRFFLARSKNETIEHPKAWLFRVVRNLAMDHVRKKTPELLDEEGWEKVEAHQSSYQELNATELSLQISSLPWHKLSRTEKECLQLRAEGLKFREVAEILDITISTVASYVARAIEKLKTPQDQTSEPSKQPRSTAIRRG